MNGLYSILKFIHTYQYCTYIHNIHNLGSHPVSLIQVIHSYTVPSIQHRNEIVY